MPWYEGYKDHTPDEERLDKLGFWKLEIVEKDNGAIPHDTVVQEFQANETVHLEQPVTVIHRYRRIHKGYLKGNYLGPNPILQTEKLMECCLCGITQWVPADLSWTSQPPDSPYHTPYQCQDIKLRRPARIDSASGWTLSQIDLLRGMLAYCPQHAPQAGPVDQKVTSSISSAIRSAMLNSSKENS